MKQQVFKTRMRQSTARLLLGAGLSVTFIAQPFWVGADSYESPARLMPMQQRLAQSESLDYDAGHAPIRLDFEFTQSIYPMIEDALATAKPAAPTLEEANAPVLIRQSASVAPEVPQAPQTSPISATLATSAKSRAVAPASDLEARATLSPTEASDEITTAFGASIDEDELDTYRGASSFSVDDDVNLNLLDAINANNTINGGATGNNIVDAGSFQNTSGLVNLIQNSGNNVIIQSATIVNLDLE